MARSTQRKRGSSSSEALRGIRGAPRASEPFGWGWVAIGSLFLFPWLYKYSGGGKTEALTPVQTGMRDLLITQYGVCESQATSYVKTFPPGTNPQVTPEQIPPMLLECRKERGRTQIAIILGLAATMVILPKIIKEAKMYDVPETVVRLGESPRRSQLHSQIQELVEAKERGWQPRQKLEPVREIPKTMKLKKVELPRRYELAPQIQEVMKAKERGWKNKQVESVREMWSV